MLHDDLRHAQASIDWPVSRLPSFDKRLRNWIEANIEVVIEPTDSNAAYDLVVALEKEPLPLAFVVEAGAYINSLRSSLDILATTLAHRYRLTKPDKHSFPIASSKTEFDSLRGYKGSEFVRGLPQRDRAKIESFQPYKGGDATLYALHHLDIVRKHRRLLATTVSTSLVVVSGFGWKTDVFAPVADWVSVDGKTKLGTLVKPRLDDPKIQHTRFVGINEPGPLDGTPVIAALHKFATLTQFIIRKFDGTFVDF